ncbi:unnamed protein product [Rotaria sp. Silwood2]|nr:unnamed protein product [Rotaria sp. Silwood2]CAF2851930.1 unnamed protein product [Rotaria sp. Silwood2]CAF2993842.1 unnamed protein product [Rotaria sp. Silwood2]CAF4119611.1 unnamed protein product [Rotaria sp. Silwood2]CAF4246361.1 unnamed protein product [Rotaria sp. Silwood2]
MPKWCKNNKSKTIPISTSTDRIVSSNEYKKKKKHHSLISFIFNKQQISDTNSNRKIIKDNSIYQINRTNSSIDNDLIQQKQNSILTHARGQSTISNQLPTIPSNDYYQSIQYSNLKSPIDHNRRITFKHNSNIDYHSYEYIQFFDKIINENNTCFGFSISHITSKYGLYIIILIFLGICLLISLMVIFKKL